jgi:hypothetical protein
MRLKMKKLMRSDAGFIPMMICILGTIAGIIYLCYHLVSNAHH